jgi:hypothetical protein
MFVNDEVFEMRLVSAGSLHILLQTFTVTVVEVFKNKLLFFASKHLSTCLLYKIHLGIVLLMLLEIKHI